MGRPERPAIEQVGHACAYVERTVGDQKAAVLGFVVDERLVVSVAHGFENVDLGTSHDIQLAGARQLKAELVHRSVQNDIVLLELASPVENGVQLRDA